MLPTKINKRRACLKPTWMRNFYFRSQKFRKRTVAVNPFPLIREQIKWTKTSVFGFHSSWCHAADKINKMFSLCSPCRVSGKYPSACHAWKTNEIFHYSSQKKYSFHVCFHIKLPFLIQFFLDEISSRYSSVQTVLWDLVWRAGRFSTDRKKKRRLSMLAENLTITSAIIPK